MNIKTAAVCMVFWIWGAFVGINIEKKIHKCPKVDNRLPSIIDIQERVGAEPDGKLGAETERLWNIAYCNQEAEPFFTNSGIPENY